jgi:C4-dicarboxylate-binding protein DctP
LTVRKGQQSAAGAPSGEGASARRATGALCLLLALLCWQAAPALAQATTMRVRLPISVDSPTGQNIREFARQVHARTGGALRIDLQGGDRSYEEHEIVSAVASGGIEIGATSLSQFAKDVPLGAAFLQPFLFNFDALIEAATRPESEIRTLIDKEILRRTNTRVLWWEPYGSSIIVSKKLSASDPVAIVVRPVGAADQQAKELLSACGGLPRLVLPSEAYAALQKGTVAAIAADIMHVRERELWRVADTITNLRHAPSLYLFAINEQAWQKLTPEQQEILTELGQDAQAYMWARFATIRAEAYALAAEKGMQVVPLRAEDVEAWRACSAPLLEAYMERTGEGARKIFAAYGRLRTDPCCREPPAETPSPRR